MYEIYYIFVTFLSQLVWICQQAFQQFLYFPLSLLYPLILIIDILQYLFYLLPTLISHSLREFLFEDFLLPALVEILAKFIDKQQLFVIIIYIKSMQANSCYYPSPLRKDYLVKPIRNLVPVIPKPPSKPSTLISLPSTLESACHKYADGLLIPMVGQVYCENQKSKDQGFESGIFLTKDQICAIYSTENGALHNTNYLIYPNGSIIQVDYLNGVINGWLIAVGNGFVTAEMWKKGYKQGKKYYYDDEQKLLVISEYKRNQLILISNGQNGNLETLIKDVQLLERISLIKDKTFRLDRCFPRLCKLNLGITYYGQLSQNKQYPNGYGILFHNDQIYVGNFTIGQLNGMGLIKFDNGDIYYGQLNNGCCLGYGKFCYSSPENMKVKQQYKFDGQNIQRQQFQRYIEMQHAPNNSIKWFSKFKSLQNLHRFYKQVPVSIKIKQNNVDNPEKSQINLDIQYTESKKQEFVSQQSSDIRNRKNYIGNQTYGNSYPNLANKNNTFIPKLSLFQQMKNKEKSKLDNGDRSARVNQDSFQKSIELDKKRTQTQRNQRDQLQKTNIQVTPSAQKYKNSNNLQTTQISNRPSHNYPSSSPSPSFKLQQSPYQHIRTEHIENQKWHVTDEHNFMRPYQMQAKPKINRNLNQEESRRMRLDKNQRNPYINMGKLVKVGSDVGDAQEEDFIRRMVMPKYGQVENQKIC